MINNTSFYKYVQRFCFYPALFLFLLTGCHVDRSLDVQDRNTYQDCTHDEFFQSNLCDYELEHFEWAAAYPEFRNLDDLNRTAMQKIMRDAGDVDRAAAVFAHRVITEPRNRKLLEYLDRRESEIAERTPDFSDLNILFAVVPGMFYLDNPNVGADGAEIRYLAQEMGLDQSLVLVDQTGTVEENARTICEFVAGQKHRRGIILASVSKGSADVKMAIHQCGREPYFRRVIGWYNIGGINRGTILINEIENDWYYRTEARTYFCLNGYNWEGFRSMRFAEEAPLNFNLELPEHVLLINIIGVPTHLSVTERARPYWEHLAEIGPNDGLSLLTDVYMPGGVTWVSWRNDHYFRWPIDEHRIQAFLSYIVETQRDRLVAAE